MTLVDADATRSLASDSPAGSPESPNDAVGCEIVAEFIEVTGIVQGVGFRPFVFRLAAELGVTGRVGNDSSRVFVEAFGTVASIDALAGRLRHDAPPLAMVEDVRRRRIEVVESTPTGFSIVESRPEQGARTLVAPDTAVCDECVAELRDPADRRFGHPFITCTNCGPRFTIICDLPYDRGNTTMVDFEMCAACRAEYRDPADRRYHAQPIGCHDCGPTLTYRMIGSPAQQVGERPDPIDQTVDSLVAGGIVAVKGLGGFHLVCDATLDSAVDDLRRRKQRPDKPFAIMVRDLDAARSVGFVDDEEAALLTSAARPIVLLRARPKSVVSPLVAPDNPLIGVMLPYTPVHHLLFDHLWRPLVMTSGNRGGEPIAHLDIDVDKRLGELCDAFLTHDRPIHVPCDDSVVRVVNGRLLPIRRARGYAPIPVTLGPGVESDQRVLAVGGELKNTFCLVADGHAWVSQHIGDMENVATLDAFDATVNLYRAMYGVVPDTLAMDAHPGYLSSAWARDRHGDGLADDRPHNLVEVQHHHAHIAAVMAEHGLDPDRPVIGIAFDGTGYGDDGAIWGGEVLVATAAEYQRTAHLAYVPLPGGDAAVRNPNRVALAHLWAAGIPWDDDLAPLQVLSTIERNLLEQQLRRDVACIPTSSMGRLFDAVASLVGLRHHVTYEAQAAIELEFAAMSAVDRRTVLSGRYGFDVAADTFDPAPILRSIVDDLRAGLDVAAIAWAFHDAVADLVVTIADREREQRGLHVVALSGGVFQNALLTTMCVERLASDGLTPLTHRLVPPNDGGLSLGQAFVAAHRSAPRRSAPQPEARKGN